MRATEWLTFWIFALTLTGTNAAVGYGQVRPETSTITRNKSEVLAEVNGRVITQEQVDDLLGQQLYSLQEKLYNLRKNTLNSLITKILLEDEARAKGITVEELKKRLTPDSVEVQQSEIDQVYVQYAVRLASLSEDEGKQKIKVELESRRKFEKYQASVAAIRTRAKVNLLLKEPIPPMVRVSDDGPSKGPKTAPITLIEFSDFQCAFCKQATSTLKQVLQSYENKVKIVFKHFPLPNHPQAFKAAQASFCAGEQGKFWEYHDLLFDRSEDLSVQALDKYAEELGLKADQFKTCLDSDTSRTAITKDIQEGKEAGVSATPTFVINGRLILGAKDVESFKTIINQELKSEPRNVVSQSPTSRNRE